MNLEERIDNFLKLDYKVQLDSWSELLSVGNDFLENDVKDINLAKKIAESIFYHRSLMGSSKAYESATEIDVQLCKVSTPIARVAFAKSKPLLEYLKSELYYSNYRPIDFNKEFLQNEIDSLNNETA